MSETPTFNPKSSRFDQSTFSGRLSHFRQMVDPKTLLTTPTELKAAQGLLERHAKGEAADVSDDDLWEAKRIKDAVIHPVTGEEMFLPGRMSAFVPVNTIPTAGMLLARSPAATVFWQWINQSVNVMCNYVNRSGATIDTSQVAQAYGLAVGVSCSIAVGAGKLVQSGPPWVRRLGIAVPYAAVVAAGASNVAFTRLPEMTHGVPVVDADGNALGVSKKAAVTSVAMTVASRNVVLPIAPMLLPPITLGAMRAAMPFIKGTPALAVEVGLVAASIYFALPVAIAIFPQELAIPVNALEPEFQGLKDSHGNVVTSVLCNKGL
eukprot:CAMPEP_0119333994 /NCGR_PEP_ID=MMETSP1333-20130426/86425_1 /TAXON_ID=418940 /ORGANISM="Scyphosphaera apsteinii, Strain RCC1455" /LENGTH=320 /DNA_ID=CAMNT_0007344199 /DNA_START=55 /DNA_END=1017 /DNA_ORIENTATION=-